MDPTWKMLVYISADNTLYNDALVSLRQLTDASLQNNVDITVQLDGPTPDQVSRYRCAGGRKKLLWVAPNNYTLDPNQRLRHFLGLGDATLSDAAPLGTVYSDAAPSDEQRIALILWGHGAGLDTYFQYIDPANVADTQELQTRDAANTAPAKGNGATDTRVFNQLSAGNANLYVKNIQLAATLKDFANRSFLNASPQRKIGKIDLLGLDSCLMGMAEICHEVSPSVSLMIASDEEVPVGSWPYDSILGDLNKFPGMDANTLSAVIINRFVESYSRKGHKTRVSLSSMNLSASDDLVKAVKGLVDALNAASNPAADKDGHVKRTIFRARDAARTPDEVTYIDFVVFCEELSESCSGSLAVCDAAKNVRDLLLKSSYILYHRDAREDGSMDPYGLAIYFPETLSLTTAQINDAVKSEPLPLSASVKFSASNKLKFPAGNKLKFPAGNKLKFAAGPQIIGYEILWPSYKELTFNKETGWAALVEHLVGSSNQETGQTAEQSAVQTDGQATALTPVESKKQPDLNPASTSTPRIQLQVFI